MAFTLKPNFSILRRTKLPISHFFKVIQVKFQLEKIIKITQ